MDKQLPASMLTWPTVFAVGHSYQIFMPFADEVILWVKVGECTYYDDCNGILRSNTRMHRVELPMAVLDAAGEYTVVYRKMIDRAPYFPTSEEEVAVTVSFRPIPLSGEIHIYHVADAHNLVAEPVAAGRYFGDELDLLILNGDIPNHSGDIANFNAICEIASGITGGHCPVVFARGNHDTRGIHAEDMPHYIPTHNGRTYYTFRAGPVWGLLLDCGEDKDDSCAEYGHTVCFHRFRLVETEYIRDVIARAAEEYEAEGVRHKLVISHVPFAHVHKPPFDIEQELYREWAGLIGEHIKPQLLIHGHHHKTKICPVGGDMDDLGQPCTAVIGSRPLFANADRPRHGFVGCAMTLREDGTTRVVFNDDRGNVELDTVIE